MPNITDNLIERIEVAGRAYWRDRTDGRIVPVVRGGADDDGGSDDGGGDGADKGPPEKQLSQSQVDAIVAREKASAARAAKREVEDYLASQKAESDKASMDEAARAKAEAEEAKADAQRIKFEAAQERLTAKVERKLSAAGVDERALAKATRLVDLEADASDDDIAAEVETLRNDMPGLFAKSEEDDGGKKSGKAASGVTNTGKRQSQPNKTAMERGRDLYREKHPDKTTSAA